MQVEMTREGGTLTAHLIGELDHHTAAPIRNEIDAAVLAARSTRLVLDLSRLSFMDSSGIGLIMGRYALVKQCGGTLSVLDPSPAVVKIIKLAGMERMVSILRTKTKQ